MFNVHLQGYELIGFRQERGIEGELLVSLVSNKLSFRLDHHDFDSTSNYCKTQGSGVDLWNHDVKLYIEVKHFPNSYLSGTRGYYRHIQSRFRNVPINSIKLVIQIKGNTNKSFKSKLRQENIYFIHVKDSTQLKGKLRYFLQRLGLLDNDNGGWVQAYKDYTIDDDYTTDDSSILYESVITANNDLEVAINDHPPPSTPLSSPYPLSDSYQQLSNTLNSGMTSLYLAKPSLNCINLHFCF